MLVFIHNFSKVTNPAVPFLSPRADLKTLPLDFLMLSVHPTLYPVHNLEEFDVESEKSDGEEDSGQEPPDPPILPLSAEHIDRHGIYLMDAGTAIYLWVGRALSDLLCKQVRWKRTGNCLFNFPSYAEIVSNKIQFL